jgi:hypothetical protein
MYNIGVEVIMVKHSGVDFFLSYSGLPFSI